MSDAREAYLAALSGATSYTPQNTDDTNEQAAFQAGIATTQANKPDIFQDSVSVQSDGSFKVDKNPLQQQLDNLQNQDDAFDFINTIQGNTQPMGPGNIPSKGILDANILGYIKDPLVALGAFTTDPTENRNVYQLLINKILQGNQPQMSGAQPLNYSGQLNSDEYNRIGRTLFAPPNATTFGEDLAALFTGKNPATIDLRDLPGGGIAELPEFGQAGLDFAKEQGIKDYGKLIEGLITGATPLKYGKLFFDKTLDTVGALPELGSNIVDTALIPVDKAAQGLESLRLKLIDSIEDE